jgi:thymidine phosphorylase
MRGFVSSVKQDIDRELAAEELKAVLEKQTAVPELEELIDELSGEPLQADESLDSTAVTQKKHVAGDDSGAATGLTTDDQTK